jgi:hypothetical protein|tara:strand:+ start:159 stop:518 length:360 start_codon:yes stop_codon:yes gene_type:complete
MERGNDHSPIGDPERISEIGKKFQLKRQTRINLYEIVMTIGLTMGGFLLATRNLLGIGFIIAGLFSYMQIGKIISRDNAVPFYKNKIRYTGLDPTNSEEEAEKCLYCSTEEENPLDPHE